MSPDGRLVAYVTDRSGIPRLEVAALDGAAPPRVLSQPAQEVVSVAWSPDGAWLAYLVSPGGSICAELHVVAPDGTGARLVLVRPGFVRTKMTAGRDEAPFTTTPEVVGAAVAKAIRKGQAVVHVPRVLGPVFVAMRALPRPVFRRLPG